MKRLSYFIREYFGNLLKAYVNIIIFLPYFFSVKQLLKTLFDPWKNIVFIKKTVGFSLSEYLEIFFANTISRTIGFTSRISLIAFYLFLNIILTIIFPLIVLIYLLLSPIIFFINLFTKSEEEKKEIAKKNFLENHLLNEENRKAVEEWFENYYQRIILKRKWWELKNLFQNPPLGRHLSLGYTNFLETYAEELTDPSYLNNRLPVYDREEELKEIELVLSRSMEPNVILVGDEGVGKHAVVDSLATRIYLGHCHPQLAYRRIFRLNMEKILAQSDDYQKKINLLEQIFTQSIEAKNIILVIDNFENYCSSQPDKIDLSPIIEKYAKRNDLQFIGITEPYPYQKIIYPNEKINQLFSKITINEIDSNTALKILLNSAFNFESQYRVFITYEAIKLIIDKTQYFITDIPFPEKSLVLLDEICAYVQKQNFKKIFPTHVDEVLTKKTHIPTTLTDEIKKRLLSLEEMLFEKIVGQDYAIKEVSSSLKKSFILYSQRKKPLASFLFLGPTGVGKTETAKSLVNIFLVRKNILSGLICLYINLKMTFQS